jgi:hypothetical protein
MGVGCQLSAVGSQKRSDLSAIKIQIECFKIFGIGALAAFDVAKSG